MVQIIDPTPDPAILRHITCKNCGARLAYTPSEVRTITYVAMGHTEEDRVIDCPGCHYPASV